MDKKNVIRKYNQYHLKTRQGSKMHQHNIFIICRVYFILHHETQNLNTLTLI